MKHLKLWILTSTILSVTPSMAFNSLSYSGRLVRNDGRPVTGPAKLRFNLAYSNSPTPLLLCDVVLNNVALSHGVFHVKLDFPTSCVPGKTIEEIVLETPPTENLVVQVIDETTSPFKEYSFQAIHSVPHSLVSNVSKNLTKMGASNNDILTWDESAHKWIPISRSAIAGGGGSVTSITAGTGLSGGTITSSGTIGIANGGVDTAQLANGSVTDAKVAIGANIARSKLAPATPNTIVTNDVAGVMTARSFVDFRNDLGLGSMAFLNLSSCLPGEKLTVTAAPTVALICEADFTLDNTKLPLDGSGVMTGTLNMGGLQIVNVADPTVPTDAATKAYVDSFFGPGGEGALWVEDAGGNINRFSGRVGIGTANPLARLHILSSLFVTPTGSSEVQNAMFTRFANTSETFGAGNSSGGNKAWLNEASHDSHGTHPNALRWNFWDGSNWINTLTMSGNGRVGIGTSQPASVFDINSTTSGILIPRMTSTQRDAISSPTGMQIYNTTTNQLNFHNGTSWQALGVAGSGITSLTIGAGLTPAGTITSSGSIAVNVGTGANQIVQLDGSGRLPGVDGSQLTNLDPAHINGVVPMNKGGTGLTTTTPGANLILGMNAANNSLEYKSVSAGSGITVSHSANTITIASTGASVDNSKLPLAGGTMTGNIVLSLGSTVTGVPTPVAGTDVANKNYVDALLADMGDGLWQGDGTHVYRTSGNVGIGLNNPAEKLHIDGGNLRVSDSGSGFNLDALNGEMNFDFISTQLNGPNNVNATITFRAHSGSAAPNLHLVGNGRVGLGNSNPASVFDIASTTSGILIPRMTTTQRDAISPVPVGTQIYNTTTNQLNYHNGTSWQALGIAGSGITSLTIGTGLTPTGTITSTGSIAVNVGTGANQIVQLDGSSRLPGVDGSQLTNLNPANINGVVPMNKGGTGLTATAPGANLVLGINASNNGMEYKSVAAGSGITVSHSANTITIASTGTGVDNTKLPLAGGTMTGNIVLSLGSTVTGVPLPLAGADAVNKDYVDDAIAAISTGASSVWTESSGNVHRTSGNVGIGTTSPGRQLTVNNAADAIVSVRSGNTSDASLYLGDQASENRGQIRYGNSDDSMVIATNGTEKIRILSGGNVGIGTYQPAVKLEVSGAIVAGSNYISSTTLNFGTANIVYSGVSCRAFTLTNLKSGGSYTFVNQYEGLASTCSFTATNTSGDALIIHMPPDHGPTIANKHTIYSFFVANNHVYFSWVPGM